MFHLQENVKKRAEIRYYASALYPPISTPVHEPYKRECASADSGYRSFTPDRVFSPFNIRDWFDTPPQEPYKRECASAESGYRTLTPDHVFSPFNIRDWFDAPQEQQLSNTTEVNGVKAISKDDGLTSTEREIQELLEETKPAPAIPRLDTSATSATRPVTSYKTVPRYWRLAFGTYVLDSFGAMQTKLTPYQGHKTVCGEFRCKECNRPWRSAASQANQGQPCVNCNAMVFPHRQMTHKKALDEGRLRRSVDGILKPVRKRNGSECGGSSLYTSLNSSCESAVRRY